MYKLPALRNHLLGSTLGLTPDKLLTFADAGKIVSHAGESNKYFRLEYTASVIVTGFGGSASEIGFVVLQWLDQNQPDRGDAPIHFEADILDHDSADVALKIALSETIAVRETDDGFALEPVLERNLDQRLGIVSEVKASHVSRS